MRIVISGPPPWAQSGYGVQVALAAEALVALGHEVAISAYAGVHEERDWSGIQILGTGGKPYGNGVIAGNYRRWNADLVLFICDPWTIDPAQLAGLHVMAWMPIDVDKLGLMERQWLERLRNSAASVRPVAMSKHGQECLAAAGWDAPLVPHAFDERSFYPSYPDGQVWRESLGIDKSAFVISKIGVNQEDDRKAFEVTLLAFAGVVQRAGPLSGTEALLYLHTEAQAKGAPNLAMMALDLGLRGRVAFANEDRRAADLYSAADMREIYNGSDVLDAATKGEGFGVPVIEALACGTPVIGCRNSAMTEKIRPEYGWLVSGQQTWARHHNAWWTQPSVPDLMRAYDKARTSARSMRKAAAAAGARWDVKVMQDAWAKALESPARPADHGKVFTEVYRSGAWGEGSGPGSDPEAAMPYIDFLEAYMNEHDPARVLDLGCGDGRLARAVNWGRAEYVGLDVVTGHDIRTCDLPDADLVLVKDVFQHWSNADIQAMLPRLARYPHVLITNTISEDVTGKPPNSDIAAGQWRAVILLTEPFCWPASMVFEWQLPHETKAVMELTNKKAPGSASVEADGYPEPSLAVRSLTS